MSPNIISWRASADNYTSISSASPVSSQSAAPSVVSIDSIGPGGETMDWPHAREPRPATGESQVKLPLSVVTLSEPKAPISLRPAQDEGPPSVRHDTYYFEDGNITFLVDGALYCVHRYFFARDSVYFSTKFARLNIREHEALDTLISLGDVERVDFEAFLSILYPPEFDGHNLSYEQWKAVLHLSTLWGFASIRRLALASLKPPTPFDQLLLGRAYSVEHYIVPALSSLCERPEPLTLGEVRQMRPEDFVLVASVRESIRGAVLEIEHSDITASVQVALSHLSVSHTDGSALLHTLTTAKMRAEAAELEECERAVSEACAEAEAEARQRAEAESRALGEYEEAMTRVEAEEAEAKAGAKAQAQVQAKTEAEAKTEPEAEVEAKEAADAKAAAQEALEAAAKAAAEAMAKADAEVRAARAEAKEAADAKARADAAAEAGAEAIAKAIAKVTEQEIFMSRAAAKCARVKAKAYAEAQTFFAEAKAKAEAERAEVEATKDQS